MRTLVLEYWRRASPRRGRVLWLSTALALGAATPGCDGCGAQKPYTPFGVASAVPAPDLPEAPVAEPPPNVGAGSGFSVRKAELVPQSAVAWQGSGLNLNAPRGRRFALVLPADFDGDGTLEALAWLTPPPNEKSAPPGELWYFPTGAAPRQVSALPGFVPSSADCTLKPNLTQTGEHSATLDVTAQCRSALIARAPSRAISIVMPTASNPVLLTLRASSSAPDETLDFSVDSSDQDHDGRGDVRLTATLSGPETSEPVSADLLWFDRAAGPSRSASEPAASLLSSIAKFAPLARTKKAADVSARIASARRLLSTLCAEGGVARVFDEDGAPLRCGDLSHVADALAQTEVSAALAQNNVLDAFAVLGRDGWYFGNLSSTQRKSVERELLHAVTKFDCERVLVARAEPALPKSPHYSPLWFEPDGALLIRTATAVNRVSADRSAEEPVSAEAGAPSWPLDLSLPTGQRVLGLVHACDRSELLLNRADAQHPLLPPLSTRILAARPASCTGHGTGPAVTIAPLNFDENGLEALISGARTIIAEPGKKPASGLPAMGTPLSPDGRWLVTSTRLGLLLVGDQKELWQVGKLPEHADPARFTDCAVANGAQAVACIDSGRVVLFERPKPNASSSTSHKK